MVYDIEFICHINGKPEALSTDVVRLVGQGVTSVIERAGELYRTLAIVPRPTGFRIRESDGAVVYEFIEPQGA